MFGHQDTYFYGMTWKWEYGRSDVHDVCGDYPAVLGCELGGLELGNEKNLDGVPFDKMRQEIIKHYQNEVLSQSVGTPIIPLQVKMRGIQGRCC